MTKVILRSWLWLVYAFLYVPILVVIVYCLIDAKYSTASRFRDIEVAQNLLELVPVLGDVYRFEIGAEYRHPHRMQGFGEIDRCLAAEL